MVSDETGGSHSGGGGGVLIHCTLPARHPLCAPTTAPMLTSISSHLLPPLPSPYK